MWVLTPGKFEETKGVIFKYSKSRSGEVSEEILKNYKNILVTDGYAGYNKVEEHVTHAECWAHARRYFYDSIPLINKKPDTAATGYMGVKLIDELFKAENEIDEQVVRIKELEEAMREKLKLRQEKMEPILKEFYEWVNLTSEKYIVNKKLKEALTYAINQKKQLSEFINDSKIPLTNSKCERAIRPFATHRKNWLFADTVDGAKANAVYYSFIESAKLNKLNIYKYINYLLKELPQLEGEQKETDIEKYLPWSKELPEEILNYQGTYEELNFEE